eukprot:2435323-Pleurochrysis_carterae.AAC.1
MAPTPPTSLMPTGTSRAVVARVVVARPPAEQLRLRGVLRRHHRGGAGRGGKFDHARRHRRLLSQTQHFGRKVLPIQPHRLLRRLFRPRAHALPAAQDPQETRSQKGQALQRPRRPRVSCVGTRTPPRLLPRCVDRAGVLHGCRILVSALRSTSLRASGTVAPKLGCAREFGQTYPQPSWTV